MDNEDIYIYLAFIKEQGKLIIDDLTRWGQENHMHPPPEECPDLETHYRVWAVRVAKKLHENKLLTQLFNCEKSCKRRNTYILSRAGKQWLEGYEKEWLDDSSTRG